MKWFERWQAIPADVRAAYVSTAGYVSWLVLLVVVGVDLVLWMMACLIYPWLGLLALVLGCRLLIREHRLQRLVALLLISCCIGTWWHRPGAVCLELHLISRVYLAGGPHHINDWAQPLIGRRVVVLEESEIPAGIQTFLGNPWVGAGDVYFEQGGGHFHYGVAVHPKGTPREPEWWQTLLGWPPELVIYQE